MGNSQKHSVMTLNFTRVFCERFICVIYQHKQTESMTFSNLLAPFTCKEKLNENAAETYSWSPLPWKCEVEIVMGKGWFGYAEVSIFSIVFAPRICQEVKEGLRSGSCHSYPRAQGMSLLQGPSKTIYPPIKGVNVLGRGLTQLYRWPPKGRGRPPVSHGACHTYPLTHVWMGGVHP